MRKIITISVVSLFFGVAATLLVIYAIDFYKMRTLVYSDRAALTEVVNFINESLKQAQAGNQSTGSSVNQVAAPTQTATTTKAK